MPKRRRHQPGVYKPKAQEAREPEFVRPLSLFQGPDGLWGAKDAVGKTVIEPVYRRLEQTDDQREANEVRLASREEVLSVTPDDWDIVAWVSTDFLEKDM